MCICKKAALTIRTATGIAKFRDDKCLGSWFDKLYPLIKSRDSCQPERGMEPLLNENEQGSSQAVYVPIKSKRVKPNELLVDVVKTVNKLAEKDDTKELLDFMREENEKNRKQQMEMYKLESSQFMEMMKVMFNSQQQAPSSARLHYPPREETRYQPPHQYHRIVTTQASPQSSTQTSPEESHLISPPRSQLMGHVYDDTYY